MFRELRSAGLLALLLAPGLIGCVNDASAPPLQGPSELGTSVEMQAIPFLLTSDGQQNSVIQAVVRDQNGQRVQGVTILFDIQVPGTSTFRSYLDLGVLAPQGAPRPNPGGNAAMQTGATTGADGVARVVYWTPYRTDQENDIIVTIIGRPTGVDYRTAVARQVDIFLRAANRPSFPGTNICSFIIEPQQITYRIGQQIFVTAAVSVGPTGFPIARYEWDFGELIGIADTAQGREASYVYTVVPPAGGVIYNIVLYTTELITGSQTNCLRNVNVFP